MPWSWDADTRPFSTGVEPAQPGRFELRQVGDDTFMIITPFVFAVDGGATPIRVTPELLGPTDLASIPTFLGWFARRHGRHTPAALLHDQLIHERRTPPVEADRLFRDALIASDVPLVKTWVLWTGVTLGTRWRSGGPSRAALIAWFVAALAGTGLLVFAIATGRPSLVAVALLAPVPFAALWGRQYRAGLIAGYAFWPVLFGSGPAWLAYQAYRLTEYAARWLRKLRPRNRHAEFPDRRSSASADAPRAATAAAGLITKPPRSTAMGSRSGGSLLQSLTGCSGSRCAATSRQVPGGAP